MFIGYVVCKKKSLRSRNIRNANILENAHYENFPSGKGGWFFPADQNFSFHSLLELILQVFANVHRDRKIMGQKFYLKHQI